MNTFSMKAQNHVKKTHGFLSHRYDERRVILFLALQVPACFHEDKLTNIYSYARKQVAKNKVQVQASQE